MVEGAEHEERPTLKDVPFLLRTITDKLLDLGKARFQLFRAEMREEAQQRIRRAAWAVVPVGFFFTAFAFLNLGILALLAPRMGPAAAALLIAAFYVVLGLVSWLWFRSTGGLNPPPRDK